MDIPAIHLVKPDDVQGNSPPLLDAVEMYININVMREVRRKKALIEFMEIKAFCLNTCVQ